MLMGERAILIKRREYTNMDKNSYEKKIQSLEEEIKIMKERYQILVETTSAILFEYKPAEDKMIFNYNFPENKSRREINNCFLQALFGQNCKIFLDIVAKRFWTLLHVQIGQSCNAPAGCVINQP